MRAFLLVIGLCACGAPPQHVAIEVVTPLDTTTIASIDFEVLGSDGASLTKKTATTTNGTLGSVNFAPPKGVTVAALKATARDSGGVELGIGQTHVDFSHHGSGTATVYVSSPSAIAFAAHPRPSAQHRFHSSTITTSDNKVWIVGGQDENGRLITAVESYDPYTLAFTTGLSLDAACLDPILTTTTFSTNEIVIVAGGTDLSGAPCTKMQGFVPAANAKTDPVAMPIARADGFALALPGRALSVLFGGSGAAASTGLGLQMAADASALGYGVKVVSFTTDGEFELIPPRTYGAVLLADASTAYFAGDSTQVTSFDVATGRQHGNVAQFADIRTMPPATVVAGEKSLYVLAGGASAIERWSVGGVVGPPIAQVSGNPARPQAVEIAGPKLVVAGGVSPEGNPVDNVWIYDLSKPDTPVSITGLNLLAPRAGHRMVLTATHTLLVIGGSASDPTSEIYSLP